MGGKEPRRMVSNGGRGRRGVVVVSSLAMEAEAAREVLSACAEEGCNRVIIESDSSNLISLVKGEKDADIMIDSIIFDI